MSQPDGAARLWTLLDSWTQMNEDQWTQAAVNELMTEIFGVFRSCPTEAEGFYETWRQAHPKTHLL